MNIDKYELIDRLIISMEELADAKGVRRCTLIVSIVQALATLKQGLKGDEDRDRGNANTDKEN